MVRERVHLLCCTDRRYLQHLAVGLTSLLANTPDLDFEIVVVGRADEELDGDRLRRSLARFGHHTLRVRTFSPPPGAVLPLNPEVGYPVDIWTRIWMAEFFDETVDRLLYLDSDLVVVGSIAPLWRMDLEGALLGTVDIPGSQQGVKRLGMAAADGYFNSGVLLVDLRQWRATGAQEEVLHYARTNAEKLHDPDQDALNACFHARRKRLGYEWNVIRPFYRDPSPLPLSPAEIAQVRRKARIIHFNGASKPWSYFCDHPRKDEYERYLRMTEWRDFVPADRTLANRTRRTASRMLPAGLKQHIKQILALRGPSAQPAVSGAVPSSVQAHVAGGVDGVAPPPREPLPLP